MNLKRGLLAQLAVLFSIVMMLFAPAPAVHAKEFTFETEVTKVMDIIIRSLYKTKEIFLRELISNASDAIEKMRVLALTDSTALKIPSVNHFNISIHPDVKGERLIIQDNGIGMTFDDLKKNLGTIAKSGTADFLSTKIKDAKAAGADNSLIGQFGVGFYSAFLVADSVSVHTKNPKDKQYVWRSRAGPDSKFEIEEDTDPEVVLDHGTRIVLQLKKKHASEYTRESRLKDLISHYSEFITFPIHLNTTKEIEVDAPAGSADEAAAAAEAEADDASEKEKEEEAEEDEDEDEDEAEGENKEGKKEKKEKKEKPKPKIKKTVHEMVHVNVQKPIWMRDPANVTTEEHNKFFKSVFKEYSDPLKAVHFKGEGGFDFRGLVFIPSRPEHSILHVTPDKYLRNIRLFVRRVFISDELLDFLPRFLSFVKGVIDSDDFPLNVSRENLQKNKYLPRIKEMLINKVMHAIEQISQNSTAYAKFYDAYSGHLKMGVMETQNNEKRKIRLAKLLRFHSTHNMTETAPTVSLDDYIRRMRKNQTAIYYLTGDQLTAMRKSPYIERPITRGYEVMLLDDGLDEYLMQRFSKYGKFSLKNVAQGTLDFGDETESEKEDFEKLKDKFTPLTNWFTALLNDTVEATTVSRRLTTSACALVAAEHGWTGRFQSIMSSQKGDHMTSYYMGQKKKFEINPNHPVILSLLAKVEADVIDKDVEDLARSLYDMSLIAGNYPIADIAPVIRRIENAVRLGLGVDLTTEAKVDVKPAPEVDADVKVPTEDDSDSALNSAPDSFDGIDINADLPGDEEGGNVDVDIKGSKADEDTTAPSANEDENATGQDEL